ncbi:hypothetical protein BSL78_05663 [Apostichopus japonicus]|uniref:SRCR domain-containing protein n=1 Tax=Stichopus japonicus TaxID=307972 RepID=A0A2G8LAW1_STIJA|nr:hypothetical protein BSL78_05663 [Apostichopus japonicus]
MSYAEFSLAISQLDGTVYTVSESHWGAMCHYDDNGAEVALVICRELGFTEGEVIPGEETVQGPVLSINYCHGFESSIRDCRTQPLGGDQCFPIQRITKVNCFNGADPLDEGNVYDSVPYSPDDDDYGSPVSGIVFFILVSSFFGSICYCVCCKRSDRRATNRPDNTTTTNTMALAPVPGPPPAYKDVVALPGQGTPMVYHHREVTKVYPQPGGPGYQPVPTQPPGYPPSGGPGYPPSGGPGYPPSGGPGYPPSGGPGYQPAQGSGYPPAPGSGYHPTGYPSPSSVPPPGYPPPEYPPVGAPSNPLMAGPGYPTQSNPPPFLGTSASPPPYPGGTPHSYSAGAASQDIQLQPYPVNEKQGPPDQSSYQQGPPDQSSYQQGPPDQSSYQQGPPDQSSYQQGPPDQSS